MARLWICEGNTGSWTCLNYAEYYWICWHIPQKQTAEYARILNVSDTVYSIRSMYKLVSSYQDRDVFRTLSNIWDGAFCKKNNAWVQVCNQKFFTEILREVCGHFNKDFVKNPRRKDSVGKHFAALSPKYP